MSKETCTEIINGLIGCLVAIRQLVNYIVADIDLDCSILVYA